jgi:hypothetical protein
MNQDAVKVAPAVELAPNAGDCFRVDGMGLPDAHVHLVREFERFLQPGGRRSNDHRKRTA